MMYKIFVAVAVLSACDVSMRLLRQRKVECSSDLQTSRRFAVAQSCIYSLPLGAVQLKLSRNTHLAVASLMASCSTSPSPMMIPETSGMASKLCASDFQLPESVLNCLLAGRATAVDQDRRRFPLEPWCLLRRLLCTSLFLHLCTVLGLFNRPSLPTFLYSQVLGQRKLVQRLT